MLFFNRGDTEGTYSLEEKKIDVCACFVLCKFVSGLILWFLENLWFDDLHAEWMGDRLNFVFSLDVILYG